MNQSRPNAEDVVVKDGDGGAHPPPLIDRTDLGLAVFILAVCGYLYWVTTGFDSVADMFAQDVPPEFFPRLLLWTIAVLTLGLPFEHLLLRKKGESLDEERAVRVKPIAYKTAALLLIVVVSIPWLGTTLSMAAAGLTIPVLWGERRIKVLVPYAIILPLGVTFVFSYLLGVYFEPGIFGS
jgi:putative tricarboxylic transport membrane protein